MFEHCEWGGLNELGGRRRLPAEDFFLTVFVLVVPVTSVSPSLPIMVIHPETDTRGSERAFENGVKVRQLHPLIPHPLLTRNIKRVTTSRRSSA